MLRGETTDDKGKRVRWEARRAPSLVAVAYGVAHGCRIVRVHDVAGTVRVVRIVERLLEAEAAQQ